MSPNPEQPATKPPAKRVDVFWLRSGQPRPYADAVYEADLVFSNWWESTTGPRAGTWCPSEAEARELARVLVRPFSDPPIVGPVAYLSRLEKVGPQTWRVVVVEPYTD